MAKSARQKTLKRRMLLFGGISTLMWLCTAIVIVLLSFTKLKEKDSSGIPIFSEEIKSIVVSIGVTVAIGLCIAVIIKEKVRTAIYMGSLILATLLYKEVGMYTILGIWFTDEYIVYMLYKRFKKQYEIRREIDYEG